MCQFKAASSIFATSGFNMRKKGPPDVRRAGLPASGRGPGSKML